MIKYIKKVGDALKYFAKKENRDYAIKYMITSPTKKKPSKVIYKSNPVAETKSIIKKSYKEQKAQLKRIEKLKASIAKQMNALKGISEDDIQRKEAEKKVYYIEKQGYYCMLKNWHGKQYCWIMNRNDINWQKLQSHIQDAYGNFEDVGYEAYKDVLKNKYSTSELMMRYQLTRMTDWDITAEEDRKEFIEWRGYANLLTAIHI